MGSRGGTATATAVLAALLAGCGPQSSGGGAAEAPPVAPEAAPRVTCGYGQGWPVSVMADGVDSPFDAEGREVLADLLADREVAVGLRSFLPDGADTEFRVLRDDGDRVTLGVGRWTDAGPGRGASVQDLARRQGTWEWDGGGDCSLEPVLDRGATWVEVQRATPSPDDDRVLAVRLSERECTSSRDPGPFLREPTVTETDDSVLVSWTSDEPGSARCPGNPSVTRTLRLEEPHGDRAVLDGSTWPPSEVPTAARQ